MLSLWHLEGDSRAVAAKYPLLMRSERVLLRRLPTELLESAADDNTLLKLDDALAGEG